MMSKIHSKGFTFLFTASDFFSCIWCLFSKLSGICYCSSTFAVTDINTVNVEELSLHVTITVSAVAYMKTTMCSEVVSACCYFCRYRSDCCLQIILVSAIPRLVKIPLFVDSSSKELFFLKINLWNKLNGSVYGHH